MNKPQADPPLVLWVVGPVLLDEVADRSAALVGTRAARPTVNTWPADFAAGLVERDVAVVSGGAYGIDGAAHRAALAADGITVAVMACGRRRALSVRAFGVAAPGRRAAVCWSPNIRPACAPARRQFLARNRLVAALSGATVVVEAGLRSGAANTAAWAKALGRQVGAVPGPITSGSSAGCHVLISAGSNVITRAVDIVELVGRLGEFAPDIERPVCDTDELTDTELAVYEALPRRGSRTIDEVAVTAGRAVTEILGPLTMLEVRGLVFREDGQWKLARR